MTAAVLVLFLAQPAWAVSTNVMKIIQDTNEKQMAGVAITTGTGAADAGTQRVAVATGGSIAATPSGTYTVTPGTGTWPVGVQATVTVTPGTGTWAASQSGTYTVTPGTGQWVPLITTVTFNGTRQPSSASQDGTYTVTPGSGTWTTAANVQGTLTVTPGTGTWSVNGSTAGVVNGSESLAVRQQGTLTVTAGTGTFTSAANVQGTVTVTPGTGTATVASWSQGTLTVTAGTGTFTISGAVTQGGNSFTVTPGTGTFTVSGAVTQGGNSFTVTAGTGVWSVNGSTLGVVGMYAQDVADVGKKLPVIVAIATATTAPSLTSANMEALWVDTRGNLFGRYTRMSGEVSDELYVVRTATYNFANPTASGNTQIVAAQGAGISIRVLSFVIQCDAAVNVNLQSGTTAITPTYRLAANGGVVRTYYTRGPSTAANAALNCNLSATANCACEAEWIQSGKNF